LTFCLGIMVCVTEDEDGMRSVCGKINDDILVHIGRNVRHRRWMRGMTQRRLAERAGIELGALQAFESGQNRVSASKLSEIAGLLEMRVADLFNGVGRDDPDPSASVKKVPISEQFVRLVAANCSIHARPWSPGAA
jgi:transcriptional regulator with XRE-family HTH domain